MQAIVSRQRALMPQIGRCQLTAKQAVTRVGCGSCHLPPGGVGYVV
jgi:hypothetical protein